MLGLLVPQMISLQISLSDQTICMLSNQHTLHERKVKRLSCSTGLKGNGTLYIWKYRGERSDCLKMQLSDSTKF